MKKIVPVSALVAGILVFSMVSGPAAADAVADFYKGKTVRFVLGGGTGGGYDAYMRLLVRYMEDKLPGGPSAVVVNMPGGGGIKATNYIYNVAPKDGTSVIMPFFNHGVFQLIRPQGIKFDVRRMRWIGNMAELNSVLAVYHSVPVKNIADFKAKGLILASSGKGSETYIYPSLVASMIGAKLKLVLGYRGTANMTLAMESGEVEGRGGSYMSWSSLRPDWIRDKKVRFLAQAGLRKHPDMPNVPMVQEFAKTPEDRAVVDLMSAPFLTSRAIAFAPGVPKDRLSAFRAAFDATMKDPAMLASAKKRRMDITPRTGQAVEAAIADMFKASPAVIKRARAMLKY
jgi:tripartite-type tricarboxylate transporter receptor subunit TctC